MAAIPRTTVQSSVTVDCRFRGAENAGSESADGTTPAIMLVALRPVRRVWSAFSDVGYWAHAEFTQDETVGGVNWALHFTVV